ncbi:hypothetical protein [Singulisphaera sp. PoT]|uniref:hypothetical protein n=1 Tax=Singulisphaera sp. PoT TaxID=3411797 RepID=UPI003BF59895
MRLTIVAFGIVLGSFLISPAAPAFGQTGGVDPFSLYYGYYLPHQAAVAAQSTPLDTINAATAARVPATGADRPGLYDPLPALGEEDYDPLRPYSSRKGKERGAAPHLYPSNTTTARGLRGKVNMYYSRTDRYYATTRPGYGPNRNLPVTRSGRSAGMPSMPSATPGPR